MKLQSNAVPTDLPHDGITVLFRIVIDCLRHIPEKVPGLHLFKPHINAFFRNPHEPLCLLGHISQHKHARGVRKITLIYSRYVHIHDIAVPQQTVFVGNAVAHHLVDGGADAFRVALVAQRSGNSAHLLCHVTNNLINFLRTHADMNLPCNLVQNRDIQFAAFPDALKLFRSL